MTDYEEYDEEDRSWFRNDPLPNQFTKEVGTLIRQAREEVRMSQAELADAINRRQASISEMENGKMEPDISTIARLAEVLRKPVSYFFPNALYFGRPEPYNPYELELLIHFRRLSSHKDKYIAINQVRALADFDERQFEESEREYHEWLEASEAKLRGEEEWIELPKIDKPKKDKEE